MGKEKEIFQKSFFEAQWSKIKTNYIIGIIGFSLTGIGLIVSIVLLVMFLRKKKAYENAKGLVKASNKEKIIDMARNRYTPEFNVNAQDIYIYALTEFPSFETAKVIYEHMTSQFTSNSAYFDKVCVKSLEYLAYTLDLKYYDLYNKLVET
ncbi:MAG: hypothetical protein FK734_21350 [Asgard group archaeon]|nr:hypothetical protein [Asgard group archaeon]